MGDPKDEKKSQRVLRCITRQQTYESSAQHPPLALISSLLSLLQLGQRCGQTLLSPVQLFLNQLDASVQGGHITLSLRESNTTTTESNQLHLYMFQLASAGLQQPSTAPRGEPGLMPGGRMQALECAFYTQAGGFVAFLLV